MSSQPISINIELNYDLLAQKIAQQMLYNTQPPAPQQTTEKTIWDAQECADFFGVTRNHYVNIISKKTNHPAPITISGGIGRGKNLRWYSSDIKNYAAAQQQKNKKRA